MNGAYGQGAVAFERLFNALPTIAGVVLFVVLVGLISVIRGCRK